jgi:pyridoxine 5-phosphate synthase
VTKLSVNVNKVATLRNTRPQLDIPSVVRCAEICIASGAHGITVHPRPDQRHIKPRDVEDIVRLLASRAASAGAGAVELNIEGNPFIDYMPIVARARPTQATLVPDSPEASTSDHGWDLRKDGERLRPVIAELKALGARVSLFMDADADTFALARELGADRVELYTEPYAARFAAGDTGAAAPYAAAAKRASSAGLGVNAGHDLNLENLSAFLAAVPGVAEVSIGHALIGDALEYGLAETVRKYLRACG